MFFSNACSDNHLANHLVMSHLAISSGLVVAVSLPRRCCLASYIHDGSAVMMSRRSQASQVTQVKSSIQIESRSSSGHDETAIEVREVRCQYRVLRNKTKQKQRSPSKNHQKQSRRTQKTNRKSNKGDDAQTQSDRKPTEETKSTQQRHPSLTSKAQAWVPPSIAPPSRR
jgi:hypothetical protein